MKLKKTLLAAVITLSLTACGSSGGGDHSTSNADKTQLTAQIEEAKAKLTKAEAQLANAQNSVSAEKKQLTAQIEEAKTKLAKVESQLADAQNSVSAEKKQLTAQVEEAKTKLAKAEAQLADVQNSVSEEKKQLTAQVEEAKTKLAKAEAQLADAQNSASAEKKQLTAQVEEVKNQLTSAQQKLSEYEKAEQEKLDANKEAQAQKQQWIEENKRDNELLTLKFMHDLGSNERYGLTEQGFFERPYENKSESRTRIGTERFYNQQYSIVYGRTDNIRYNGGETYSPRFNVLGVHGDLTIADAIPTAGTATYSGKAFGAFDQGDFNYVIDFANKMGSGNITNLGDVADNSDVILQEGRIDGNSISGSATAHIESKASLDEQPHDPYDLNGKYILGIYGPNAEEVAGKVELGGIDQTIMRRANGRTDDYLQRSEIGFGGVRGEIQSANE